MKKIICMILAVMMCASVIMSGIIYAASERMPFTDVRSTKWFYTAVKAVWEKGIMEGKSETKFAPNEEMTRAQLVTILYRLAGAETEGLAESLTFKDTKKNAWYAEYVGWAVKEGLVNGYEDNTFKPNVPVLRQELAKLFSTFIDYAGFEIAGEVLVDSFNDAKKHPSWAKEYIEDLRTIGLIGGDDAGAFNPKSTATRAEVATIITRLLPAVFPDDTDDTESSEPDISSIDSYVADLASKHNLAGRTFTYIGNGGQAPEFEEEIGNIENDALYRRQRELEEVFGISCENVIPSSPDKYYNRENDDDTNAVVERVYTSILAGLNEYDMVYGSFASTMQPLFNAECLRDVSEFSVTNLDEGWWPATLRDTHSINGKIYFLTGPILTSYYTDASCILFNKTVAEDYNIKAPYDYVNDGSWTFDKMFELAAAIPKNDSGEYTYRYGNPQGIALLYANGITITDFDDEGVPFVESSLPAETAELCNKFSAIMGDESQTAVLKFSDDNYEDVGDKYGYGSFSDMFTDASFLFYFTNTGEATNLREKDIEFGILPYPKESGSRSQYYSYANNWDALYCAVPKCTRDFEVTDVVLEAMAALSLKHIKPAYYEKLLKGKSVYDSDSKEMLDIIFTSKVYDIVDLYALGEENQPGPIIRYLERAMIFDASSISNDYAVLAMMANKQIDKIMKLIIR